MVFSLLLLKNVRHVLRVFPRQFPPWREARILILALLEIAEIL
jgi:hypothetical protein